MRGEPAVSVVMPLFNKEGWVARSVRSVLEQTVREFELIIVNDGSTDGSRGIVSAIADPRLLLIDQQNAGVSAARNRGIEQASARLIAFCDADDEWEPEHLADLLGLTARYPEAHVFATGYFIADGTGRRRKNILRGLPESFAEGYLERYFRIAAASDPPVHTSSVAATRLALDAVGGFPAGVHAGEDLLTWARLALNNRIAYQRRPSSTFRSPGSVADRPGRAPADPDLVGGELQRMSERADGQTVEGLAAYVALWHRMRGVIFLKLGDRRRARAEFRRSLELAGWSLRICVLRAAGLLPRAGRAIEALERGRERLRGSLR